MKVINTAVGAFRRGIRMEDTELSQRVMRCLPTNRRAERLEHEDRGGRKE